MSNHIIYLKYVFIAVIFFPFRSNGQDWNNKFVSKVYLNLNSIEASNFIPQDKLNLITAIDSVNNSLKSYLRYTQTPDSLKSDVIVEVSYSSSLEGMVFFTFKNRYNPMSVQGFVYKEPQLNKQSTLEIYEHIAKPYRICLSFFVINYTGEHKVEDSPVNPVFTISFVEAEPGNNVNTKRIRDGIENIVGFHARDFYQRMNLPASIENPVNISVKVLQEPEIDKTLNNIYVVFGRDNKELTKFKMSLLDEELNSDNPFIWLSKINEQMKTKMLESVPHL